jgi:hypothetical protein
MFGQEESAELRRITKKDEIFLLRGRSCLLDFRPRYVVAFPGLGWLNSSIFSDEGPTLYCRSPSGLSGQPTTNLAKLGHCAGCSSVVGAARDTRIVSTLFV